MERKIKPYLSTSDKTRDIASEPLAIYSSPSPSECIIHYLGDKLKLSQLIRQGIPYALFDAIRERSTFNLSEWAHLLNVSYKTMLRYKQDQESFKAVLSERIIEIAEVTEMGLHVFGSQEKYKSWLHRENFALGNLSPKELLADSYGKELVLRELYAIEYGIFI